MAYAVVLLFLFMATYWFVLSGLVAQWSDDANYAHGFFVVPLAAFLAWRRRVQWQALPAAPSAWGLLWVSLGAVLYLGGVLSAELFTQRISLVPMLTGGLMLAHGVPRTRAMWLPLAFLCFMVPLPYIFYFQLTFPLQLQSSAWAAGFLSALGMPVLRMGNVIHLEGYSLEVVAACSGLRSIMTLGTLAVFLGEMLGLSRVRFLLLMAAVIPVAMFANTVRLIVTAVVSALSGPEAAEGFMHDLSGVVVFVLGLIGLLMTGVFLEWRQKRSSKSSEA